MKTQKIVVNRCYGGYSLSPKAIARIAELKGRPCYFFVNGKPVTMEKASNQFSFDAFDVPTPPKSGDWSKMTDEERKLSNLEYEKHSMGPYSFSDDRTDPDLVRAVEELGKGASGSCAKLEIREIPLGIMYEISDYDGVETIHEVHRSW